MRCAVRQLTTRSRPHLTTIAPGSMTRWFAPNSPPPRGAVTIGSPSRTNNRFCFLANRHDGEMAVDPNGEVSGTESFNNMKAYVYGHFSKPVKVEQNQRRREVTACDSGSRQGEHTGIPLRDFVHQHRAGRKRTSRMKFRVGDLKQLRSKGAIRGIRLWGRSRLKAALPIKQRVFYTALYRCL